MKVYDPDLISPSTARLDAALRAVGNEVLLAQHRFAPFASPHEAWAVIREEVDELWERVKANDGRGTEARDEATQVAAMAVRYLLDVR